MDRERGHTTRVTPDAHSMGSYALAVYLRIAKHSCTIADLTYFELEMETNCHRTVCTTAGTRVCAHVNVALWLHASRSLLILGTDVFSVGRAAIILASIMDTLGIVMVWCTRTVPRCHVV